MADYSDDDVFGAAPAAAAPAAVPQGGGTVADMMAGGGAPDKEGADPGTHWQPVGPQGGAVSASVQQPDDDTAASGGPGGGSATPPATPIAASPQTPSAPKLKADQGLGFKAGIEQPFDTMALRAEGLARSAGLPVDQINNWWSGLTGAPVGAAGVQAQHQADLAQAAAQGRAPGGIGKFLGNTALVAGTAPAGVLEGGLLGGAMLSQAPQGDWADVAKDTLLGGVENVAGGKLTDIGLSKLGDTVAGALTKNVNAQKAVDALRTAKGAAYDKFKQLGLQLTPNSLDGLRSAIQGVYDDFGADNDIHQVTTKTVGNMFDRLNQAGGATLDTLDKWRGQLLDNLPSPTGDKRGDNALGQRVAKTINDFMDNLGGGDVTAPPGSTATPQQAQLALANARQANSAYRNVELLDRKAQSAGLKAKSTYSGQNIDNRFRQTLRPLIDPDSPSNILKFLKPEEQQALQNIVEGTGVQNALRKVGSFGGDAYKVLASLGAGGSVGAMTHSPAIGAAIAAGTPIAAGISKAIANASTKAKTANLIDLMSAGGTQAGLLAQRAARSQALKNSPIGSWLATAGKDLAEYGGAGTVAGFSGKRAQTRYGQ